MMQPLKKILESRVKVRFHDCDPYNHLNNSRYIDYIVSARGDQLIEYYDFDMYKLVLTEGWAGSLRKPIFPTSRLLH